MTHVELKDLRRCPIQLRPVKKETLEYLTIKDSVARDGIYVPLLVRPVNNWFEPIDGARRLGVADDLRLSSLPCHVREMTDEEVMTAQITCNPLNASNAEYAIRLSRITRRDKDMTINTLAHLVKQHPGWVERQLGLKRLSADAKRLVEKNKITAAVAMKLAKLPVGTQNILLEAREGVIEEVFLETLNAEVRNLREIHAQ
jgi:ParB/RepB/Spo0J family partition protein